MNLKKRKITCIEILTFDLQQIFTVSCTLAKGFSLLFFCFFYNKFEFALTIYEGSQHNRFLFAG